MILGAISFCLLAIGIWTACRTEQAIERGQPVHRIQLYAGGILIIGGLALMGAGLGAVADGVVAKCRTAQAMGTRCLIP
jgi:uncharacterized membrane protein YidH (DUF202 family)